MQQEKSVRRFWIKGLLVAAVLSGILVSNDGAAADMPAPPGTTTKPSIPHRAAQSTGSAAPTAINSARGRTANSPDSEPGATRIYECRLNGQRVFSDQACGAEAQSRDIPASNVMTAREAEIGYRSSGKASGAVRKTHGTKSTRSDARVRCNALLQDKNEINARMRTGYKNNEGERLRARLRNIDSEYYDLRCRDLN